MTIKNLTGAVSLAGSVSTIDASYITGPLIISTRGFTDQPTKVKISHVQWQDTSYYSHNDIITNRVILSGNRIGHLALSVNCNGHDVDLSLPQNLEASIYATIDYGKLYSDLNLVTQPFPGKFYGKLNGGGVLISVSTHYGNIYIRKEK